MYKERNLLLKDDRIHPNENGIKKLGAAVADIIKAQHFSEEAPVYSTQAESLL